MFINTKNRRCNFHCVNNHYANNLENTDTSEIEFEYKGIKVLELLITQTRHQLIISEGKCLRSTPPKIEKIFMKCAQKRGAHLRYENNYYTKLKIKEWTLLEL